ncbi:hypothetical protein [uncultured Agrobacterium sp.]|uniref:hypothetical protein n=1 Tax=uncultured Agrobacterium sp. TaxID=157277 RepID=UPI0025D47270|nr:hypothetical protein [uncultured Agrobacterium sp.]
MKAEQTKREPSEAETMIAHIATNAHREADERAAVREAAEALNRDGRDAYAAMVASIAENERKREKTAAS